MIRTLLEELEHRKYPMEDRAQIENADLEMLDADVVGLTSQYLDSGALGEFQLPILRACLEDAERVLPSLGGAARSYFEQVRDLAAAVLHEIDSAPAS